MECITVYFTVTSFSKYIGMILMTGVETVSAT